jgi:aconitase A
MATGSPSLDSFSTRSRLAVGARSFAVHRLGALDGGYDISRLPYSIKVILENLLRHEDSPTCRPTTSWPWPLGRQSRGHGSGRR